jgi:hypothetical protein
MASYFKSVDKNHLLATGEEGYDKFPSLYSNTGLFYNGAEYLFNGYKGTSYLLNSKLNGIDYCSFHMYPGLAGFSAAAGKTWIDDHAGIAAGISKPALAGELGVKENKYSTYKFYFDELYKNGIKNCIVWQYQHKDVINNDGFGFNEINSPGLMELCKNYALRLDSIYSNPVAQNYQTGLLQNYPNPFNPITKISFDIPNKSYVSLKIYDILGKEIKTLVSEEKSAGKYIVDFDASFLSSGVYFYKLESGTFVETKRMIILK